MFRTPRWRMTGRAQGGASTTRAAATSSSRVSTDKYEDQEQSLLFSNFPLDIRRHIYMQYWLDHGITQHIYMFGDRSYLSHYACELGPDECKEYHPPIPPTPEPAEVDGGEDGEEALPVQAPQDAEDGDEEAQQDGNDDNGGSANTDQDDPGDVNGAIQQLTAAPQPQPQPQTPAPPAPLALPAPAPAPAPAGPQNNNVAHQNSPFEEDGTWSASPWCMHEACFRQFMALYNNTFERAYSRNYKRHQMCPTARVSLTMPLLVCKRMYVEASDSLYTLIRFSFPNGIVMKRFSTEVPRELRAKIQVAHIISHIWDGEATATQPSTDSLAKSGYHDTHTLSDFCEKLKAALPGVTALSLTLHLTSSEPLQRKQAEPLPGKDFFEPLYALYEELGLRKLEVQIPTVFLGYGLVPVQAAELFGRTTAGHLRDAPFSVALVPRGCHTTASNCDVFSTSKNLHN